MNRPRPATLVAQAPGYVALQHEMHDALRAQHPEWIDSNGECPTCDSYESRFAQLLSLSLANERRPAGIKRMKVGRASAFPLLVTALFALSGCVSTHVAWPDHMRRDVAAAERSYRHLAPNQTQAYNTVLDAIARDVDLATTPAFLRSELSQAGVKIDRPAVQLPLLRYHAVGTWPRPNESYAIGAPVLLEYDTSRASIYPREGMFVSATAIYRRVHNQPHLSFIAAGNNITLDRKTYPLIRDQTAATSMLARRARRVAQSGLTNLLHPDVRAKGEVVLSQPYDPNKIPILLVHGLQSTPFTFLQLANALKSDPEIAQRFQFWHFYYSTGTPVLLNACILLSPQSASRACDLRSHSASRLCDGRFVDWRPGQVPDSVT